MAKKETLIPKQKRSIATKQKIKQAAKKLFTQSGYYNVTSNNIALKAGVPIGSFYNYFGDKKDVMLELIKDFHVNFTKETLKNSLKSEMEIKSKEDVLKSIEELLHIFLLSDVLADPFYKIIHSLQYTEKDVLQLSEEIRTSKMTLLSKFVDKVSHLQPINNIPIKVKLMHSTAENIGLYMNLGTPFDKNQLITETAKMLHGYLFAD